MQRKKKAYFSENDADALETTRYARRRALRALHSLHQEEAMNAAKDLGPIQCGLGASRGNDRIIHGNRAAFNMGYALCTTDFSNAFNACNRQAMMDQFAIRMPSSAKLFHRLYKMRSLCIMRGEGGKYEKIRSEEGARMGCAAGTTAFDCAVQPTYEARCTD